MGKSGVLIRIKSPVRYTAPSVLFLSRSILTKKTQGKLSRRKWYVTLAGEFTSRASGMNPT